MEASGRLLIIVGLLILSLGLLFLLVDNIPWLGSLPGDFYYEGEKVSFYFPLTTCLLLSLILSLLFYFSQH